MYILANMMLLLKLVLKDFLITHLAYLYLSLSYIYICIYLCIYIYVYLCVYLNIYYIRMCVRDLEEPLKAAFLDSLRGQDVGQLSVGVGHQQARCHKLSNKLGDPSL